MTPEGRVKEKVKKLLREHDTYWHMPVQNGMGSPTLDFICCHRGKYLAIETKAPGGKPTERQMRTIKEIMDSDGMVFVVSNDDDLVQLSMWLGACL